MEARRQSLIEQTPPILIWETYRRAAAMQPGDNVAYALKCVVVDSTVYDLESDPTYYSNYWSVNKKLTGILRAKNYKFGFFHSSKYA
jgi:hypothetical protein